LDLDDQGKPKGFAGHLFVQPRIRMPGGGDCLFEDGRSMNFMLVTLGAAAQHWLSADNAVLWQRLGGERIAILSEEQEETIQPDDPSVPTVTESGSVFKRWMTEAGCEAIIVRPDRYIFGTARTSTELEALVLKVMQQLRPKEVDRMATNEGSPSSTPRAPHHP
jgi:3-(3-hydroxy-phenyl)propionate hydroxylase